MLPDSATDRRCRRWDSTSLAAGAGAEAGDIVLTVRVCEARGNTEPSCEAAIESQLEGVVAGLALCREIGNGRHSRRRGGVRPWTRRRVSSGEGSIDVSQAHREVPSPGTDVAGARHVVA